tara:strand:- start:160 stop:375 length:216 start_codon:yes stop_codon:yes gene_type:complete
MSEFNVTKDVIIECECDSCGAIFDIAVSDEFDDEPMYCPFCGSDLPDDDMYEDEDDDEFLEHYEDDDDMRY